MSTRRTSQRLEDSEAQLLQISTNSPNLRRGSSNLLSGLTTSAEDYLSKIQSHAETSILDSLYPGGHFADISEFLKSRLTSQSRQFPTSLEGSAFLHKIYSKTTASVTSLTTPVSLDEADAYLDIHTPHNSILFLCGYPSAEWIAHVGSRYRVDPEFWRRHAGYLNGNETSHLETRLVLPSACSSIIHLPLVSVASHKIVDGVASEDDVTRHRRNCTRDMGNYRYRLRIGLEWRAGDSIVSDFDVLDKDHFMIEQLASVYITARDEKKTSWIAIVWMDVGKDLAKSSSGPWLGTESTTMTPKRMYLHNFFHPVPQYRPGIALKYHRCIPPPSSSSASIQEVPGLSQSCSLIPRFYGRSLNDQVMFTDPFYAMSELFVFVAASELTLLKFIAIKIDKAVKDASEVDQETAITPQADLVFYRRLLERRSREVKSTLSHICNRHTLIWPTATGDSAAQSKSSLAALRSEKDFRYLIEVIEGLCGICDRELSVLVNAAGIAEAKRGIEQGKTLFGFTWLASIFVPLSFTTSLFGMNVREFEKAELPIWVWVVVTIPIFLFSVVFLFWGRIRLKDLRDRLIRLVVI